MGGGDADRGQDRLHGPDLVELESMRAVERDRWQQRSSTAPSRHADSKPISCFTEAGFAAVL